MPGDAVIAQAINILRGAGYGEDTLVPGNVGTMIDEARKAIAAEITRSGDAGPTAERAAIEIAAGLATIYRLIGEAGPLDAHQELAKAVVARTKAATRLATYLGDNAWFASERGPIAVARAALAAVEEAEAAAAAE